MPVNGCGNTSEEDEEDECPDHGAGIDSGVNLDNGSGAALEKYGGNEVGDSAGLPGAWKTDESSSVSE
jgi:hypothetical protein